MAFGLLALRLAFGIIMAAHGAQKLFGWFGGHGLKGAAGIMEALGFRPGHLFAFAAASTEFLSGLLVALGFLGPVGPALMISVMIVAAMSVHWKNGLFAQNGGIEVPLLYAAAALALAFTGFGADSLDALLGIAFTTLATLIIVAAGIIGGVANLFARRPAPVANEVKKAA